MIPLLFLRQLATYLAPGGWIVFDQRSGENEVACLDALPPDGSDPEGVHLPFGDSKGFGNAREFARKQVAQAGLKSDKTQDSYHESRHNPVSRTLGQFSSSKHYSTMSEV